jgi:hypothetical protein
MARIASSAALSAAVTGLRSALVSIRNPRRASRRMASEAAATARTALDLARSSSARVSMSRS